MEQHSQQGAPQEVPMTSRPAVMYTMLVPCSGNIKGPGRAGGMGDAGAATAGSAAGDRARRAEEAFQARRTLAAALVAQK